MENIRELSMEEMSRINGGVESGPDIKWRSLLPYNCPNCNQEGFRNLVRFEHGVGNKCSIYTICCHKEGFIYTDGRLVLL